MTSDDPFPMPELNPSVFGSGRKDTTGWTLTQSTIAAPSTTKKILLLGQSNNANSCDTPAYTVQNPTTVNVLNPYDGGIYQGRDPVLGCTDTKSSLMMPLGDRLINQAKATRVILCNVAVGGTTFALWAPSHSSQLFLRIKTGILRFRARGLEPDFILIGQGESDVEAGSSSTVVRDGIWAIVDGIRAAPISCNAPVYVGLYTVLGGTQSNTVRTGITNAVSGPRNIILGYDLDTECPAAGGFREGGSPTGTHLSVTGRNKAGPGWADLILP